MPTATYFAKMMNRMKKITWRIATTTPWEWLLFSFISKVFCLLLVSRQVVSLRTPSLCAFSHSSYQPRGKPTLQAYGLPNLERRHRVRWTVFFLFLYLIFLGETAILRGGSPPSVSEGAGAECVPGTARKLRAYPRCQGQATPPGSANQKAAVLFMTPLSSLQRDALIGCCMPMVTPSDWPISEE